jgi:alkylhydroperoxidase family enzyme
VAKLTGEEIDAVTGDGWRDLPAFDDRDRAAIRWAGIVTRNTPPEDPKARAEIRAQFTEDEFVELTLVIAMFAMLNRINDSLWMDLDEGAPPGTNLYIEPEAFRRYAETMYADRE